MSDERTSLIDGSGSREDRNYRTGSRFEEYVQPFLAEFLGVALFVCVGCLSVVGGDITAIALAHGLAILFLVAAFATVSGGHLNPAVTAGVLMAGGIRPVKAVVYVVAQLLGGLTGAGLTRGILTSDVYTSIGGGAHNLAPGVTVGQGMLCEIVLTTVLVLTVLMTAVDPHTKSPLAPVAIGVAVVAGILAGAQVSGASLNPARSFGPAVVISYSTSDYWTYHYIYWVGPLLGAVVAGLWYRLFLASSDNRLVLKGE